MEHWNGDLAVGLEQSCAGIGFVVDPWIWILRIIKISSTCIVSMMVVIVILCTCIVLIIVKMYFFP